MKNKLLVTFETEQALNDFKQSIEMDTMHEVDTRIKSVKLLSPVLTDWLDEMHTQEHDTIIEDDFEEEQDFNQRVEFCNALGDLLGYSELTFKDYQEDIKEQEEMKK